MEPKKNKITTIGEYAAHIHIETVPVSQVSQPTHRLTEEVIWGICLPRYEPTSLETTDLCRECSSRRRLPTVASNFWSQRH